MRQNDRYTLQKQATYGQFSYVKYMYSVLIFKNSLTLHMNWRNSNITKPDRQINGRSKAFNSKGRKVRKSITFEKLQMYSKYGWCSWCVVCTLFIFLLLDFIIGIYGCDCWCITEPILPCHLIKGIPVWTWNTNLYRPLERWDERRS